MPFFAILLAMKQQYAMIIGAILILLAIFLYRTQQETPITATDKLAKCLSDQGTVMYGAEFSEFSREQVDLFGDSIRFLNHVECRVPGTEQQTQLCISKKIPGYPTWFFANGEKIGGVKTLEELAEISGCEFSE